MFLESMDTGFRQRPVRCDEFGTYGLGYETQSDLTGCNPSVRAGSSTDPFAIAACPAAMSAFVEIACEDSADRRNQTALWTLSSRGCAEIAEFPFNNGRNDFA